MVDVDAKHRSSPAENAEFAEWPTGEEATRFSEARRWIDGPGVAAP